MSTLFRRSNGVFYGVFLHRGKRLWRSIGTSDPEQARIVYEQMTVQYAPPERLTLRQFAALLQRMVGGELAKATMEQYEIAFRQFGRITGDIQMRAITGLHVQKFKAERLAQVSDIRVALEFRTLRGAFNKAIVYRVIEKNPFDEVPNVRCRERQPLTISPAQFERLLGSIGDPRVRAIVVVAAATGLRLGELMNMRWEDVDLAGGLVRLAPRGDFQPKGRRSRVVPLNETARIALQALPRVSTYAFGGVRGVRPNGGWVSRRFKKYVREAGLPEELHFHSLRHTFATWLVEKEVPLPYVKELLGHRSVTTTMIYAHVTKDHLRDSVGRLDRLPAGGGAAAQ